MTRTRVQRFILTLSLLCLLAAGVSAATGTTREIDLDEAMRLASQHDATYRLAGIDVAAARLGLEQVEAGNLMQPSPTLLFQAQVGLDLTERSHILAERSLMLQVEQDYYTLLRLENILGVLDEAIRLAERQLDVAKRRQESGAATVLDVMRAETALVRHRADREEVVGNMQLAKRKFTQTLGLAAETRLILDPTVVSEDLPQITLEVALQEGADNRIELGQAAAGVSIAEKELELATNDYTPVLTRRQAEIELERAQIRQHQAQQGIQLDIENSYHAMHDAYKRMELADLELAEADENHRVVQALFAAGMATDVEILQVQTGLMQARSARVNATFDFNIARAQLFHAIGWAPGDSLRNGSE